jgi:xylulokinase
MSMDYLMAIDLGSTSLKAVIYDLDGNEIAAASRPTEKITPPDHPEWVIWDPDQIWQGTAAAAKEAVGQVDDPSLIRGISVTGMGMDGVPLDDAGNHLYPFISWHDPRTTPQAEWWAENIGSEKTFSIAGLPPWAITAAMRIRWMMENEPEIMAKTVKWLLIEDFFNHKLCGKIATDYSMATCMLLFDQARRQWSGELLQASGISPSLMPDPLPSGTPLGEVTAEAAALTGLPEGTKVILGGHDHLCGTLPVGAYKSGTLFNVIGTWECVIATIPEAILTENVRKAAICMQSHVAQGMYAAWGGAVSAESLEWYRAQFGGEAEKRAEAEGGTVWDYLLAELDGTSPGASGVMYLPHISAAGCPIDDNRALGAFVGLSNKATRADMLRAVIEGLNYQFLHIMDAMQTGLGSSFSDIVVSGGVSKNAFWIQNKADMIGLPIQVSEMSDASPRGAAMLAGIGLGLYADLEEAFERVKRPGRTIEPRKELTEKYARLFELYKGLYPALAPVSHSLFDMFKG